MIEYPSLTMGQMGVGAVFISTLALHRLPTPKDPPVTQQDHLSLMLQPIVSFVVLSSIIIRKSFYLHIPFLFSLVRDAYESNERTHI